MLELGLLWVVGLINSWGARLLQPLLALLLSFLIFGFIYNKLPATDLINHPWQKSFDIITLAGYANQSNAAQQSLHLRVLEGLQLATSIFFYTIFFQLPWLG